MLSIATYNNIPCTVISALKTAWMIIIHKLELVSDEVQFLKLYSSNPAWWKLTHCDIIV